MTHVPAEVDENINIVMAVNLKFYIFILFFLPGVFFAQTSYDSYLQGLNLIEEKKYDEAKVKLKEAISLSENEDTSKIYFELGKLETILNNPVAALSNYKKAIEQDQNFVEALYEMAYTLETLNRKSEAEKIWRDIVNKDPSKIDAWMQLASLLEERGAYQEALTVYSNILSIESRYSPAEMGFYSILTALGRCDDALLNLNKISFEKVEDCGLVMITANCFRRNGRTNESLAIIKKFLDKCEEGSLEQNILLSVLAEHYYLMNREDECMNLLKKIEFLSPELSIAKRELTGEDLTNALNDAVLFGQDLIQHPVSLWAIPKILLKMKRQNDAYEIFLNIADVADSMGDDDMCIRSLMESRKYAPTNSISHLIMLSLFFANRGYEEETFKVLNELLNTPCDCKGHAEKFRVLFSFRITEDAKKEAIEYTQCSSSNVESLVMLSLCLLDEGKYEESLNLSKKILREDPENTLGNAFAGYSLFGLFKFEDAILYLEKARTLSPTNHSILFYLAQCYDRLNRKDDAINLMTEAVNLKNDDPVYLNYLGYLMADSGKSLDKAIEYIRKALEAEPENFYYLDSLGWAYFKQSNFKEALALMLKAVEYMEKSKKSESVIYEHTGDVFNALNKKREAKKFWRKALSLDEENDNLKKKCR